MIRTFLIPILAVAGVLMAVWTVVQGSRPPTAQPPVMEPPRAPFEAFVAGSGLVEASTENIAIGAPVGALVTALHRDVGQSVKTGEPLFELDNRELRAELTVRESQLAVARANLDKMRAGTRPELLPPARAALDQAVANLDDLKTQLGMWEQLKDTRAASQDELSRRRFAVRVAETRVLQARAELAVLEAGTWSLDIAIAESEVARAAASVESTRIEIDRRIVRSPIDGVVLQVNIRAGEFASAGALATPLMLVGSVSPLHVRVDIDEHESWRVKAGAAAVSFVRGNKDISAPLTFVRFEPYVVPKRSLTGDSTERVDTRVLQVLYSFDPSNLPIFVGQQMDVFIEAAPRALTPHAAPTTEDKP
jgi:HlyD family secretion protein